MLKEERHSLIIEKINTDKKVNLVELSQLLNVSYDSIRRDIIELEDKGLLKKVHGGAVASNAYLSSKVRKGMGLVSNDMTTIARKATALVQNGQVIIMDGGSTNFYIAEQFPKTLEATIVTNNVPLALALTDHPKIDVVLLGGSFYKRYQITLGNQVFRALEHLHADLYFMGVTGIHTTAGLTVRNYEESQLKRKMADVSKMVVSCANKEKINVVDHHKVGEFDSLSTLITTLASSDSLLDSFQGKGVKIV
jgi:DeoR/GlpR family transcriptional regulator of sugar metabolism